MKSSSQYFPVALLSAEYKEGIYEDVYSLKPNTSTDNTVEIALVRLHSEQISRGHPLLLVHDAFSNHWQWLDYGVGGVAGALVRAGYDVWLMDWRGHGLSSRNQRPALNTLDAMAEFDLPPVIQFIEEKTARLPTLISQGVWLRDALTARGSAAISGQCRAIECCAYLAAPGVLDSRGQSLAPVTSWLAAMAP